MIYMVCYDISDAKRLRRTAKILEDFGIRVQKSFFQCEIGKAKMDEIYAKILKVINKKKDSFFVYPLCEDCSSRAIADGNGSLIRLEDFEIL